MTKVISCRDVGMDCDFEARAATEEELLSLTAAHAAKEHGLTEIPEEVLTKVKAAIREE